MFSLRLRTDALLPRTLPGPATAHFQLEDKVKKCPDEHEQSKHPQCLKGQVNNHREDYVRGNQKVNGQQHTEAKALSEIPIYLVPIRPLEHLYDETPYGEHSPDDQDHYRDRLERHNRNLE